MDLRKISVPSKVNSLFIIIPHFHNTGGAGKYTQALIELLGHSALIYGEGKFANEYRLNKADVLPKGWDIYFDHCRIPFYKGVSWFARLYFVLKTLFFVVWSFTSPIFRKRATFVLTSSIQWPLILWFKIKAPHCRIILCVQENLSEDKLSLGLFRYVVNNRKVQVLCIEQRIRDLINTGRNAKVGLLRNSFDLNIPIVAGIRYDLLYLGGDSRIKGFEQLIKVLSILNTYPIKLSICLAGHYRNVQRILEASSGWQNIDVNIIGNAGNIYSVIRQSRLLFMPILEPHFLRPAIESGLCGRTFVIKRHLGMSECAIHGINCLMYDTNDEACGIIYQLLNDALYLQSLEKGNMEFAIQFVTNSLEDTKVFQQQIQSSE